MVGQGDENKHKVDSQRGAGGGERYLGATVSALPRGEDLPAVHLVGLAEDV